MRDFAGKWQTFPDWTDATLDSGTWRVRVVNGLFQTLVSGAIDRVPDTVPGQVPDVGLWDTAPQDQTYRVRIARDRGLIVSNAPVDLPLGWHGDGFAVSTADDAWFVIDMDGPALPDVLAEGTTVNLEAGSPSAAVRFAGLNGALLYRFASGARLHVEAAWGPYLWRWLQTREK